MRDSLRAVIAGTGYYVPPRVITSAWIEERTRMAERYGLPAGTLERLTGVRERRHVTDGESASALAARAAGDALRRAGLDADDLDVVIFGAASHDLLEPATANILQSRLGARRAHAFDVKNACNSFLSGLDLGDALIRLGRARTVLVAAGETMSPTIDWDLATRRDLELGIPALTLGDGAGAVVLTASEEDGRGLVWSRFVTIGAAWELATVGFGGSLHYRDLSKSFFRSDSVGLRSMALAHVPPLVRGALAEVGWSAADLCAVVPHQVSLRITRDIVRLVPGLRYEQCVVTLETFGNTAAASIPIALSRAMESGRVCQGDRVLLVGAASGFSVGVVAAVL